MNKKNSKYMEFLENIDVLVDGKFINDLKDLDLVRDINDYDGNKCSYNTSYLALTKNTNDYKMEINSNCIINILWQIIISKEIYFSCRS